MMTCPNGKVKSVIFKSTIKPKNNNPKATINVGIIPGIMALLWSSRVGYTPSLAHLPPKAQ